ncbi:potassium channel family protein [uncultured Roseibium sp.]|uniref:potassium channel family protein n=1 Tax=uncultured Roseibium sp. TaxID=1936171 RepID=UPI00261BD068|nr:potassium channel family protein [uncultured Roseibium sp.]
MLAFFLNALRLLKAIARSWKDPHFKGGLLLCIFMLASGTVFYSSVEGWNWVDSLYFCAVTLSTVGYGDLIPQTDLGKLFTVIYIFAGVGVFVALFAQFARALIRDTK